MRPAVLFVCLICACLQARGQELYKFYLNARMEVVKDSLSPFIGVAVQEGSDWQVAIYDAARNTRVRHSYFDSTLSIAIGPATFFHSNGKRMMEGHYNAGRMVGLWRRWDEAGRLTDLAFYDKYSSFLYSYSYNDSGMLSRSRYDHSGGRRQITEFSNGAVTFEAVQFGRSLRARHYWPSGGLAIEMERGYDGKVSREQFFDSSGQPLSKRSADFAILKRMRKQHPYPADPFKYRYRNSDNPTYTRPNQDDPPLVRSIIHHNHDQVRSAPDARSNVRSSQRTSEEALNESMRRFNVPYMNLLNY
ncbi:MAG: hypothetical protein EOO11_06810 [Chitinophagaceae bacterium]|nr:MAG: hypothetical protein EOO11_06810 [Chitinophagaceae bacterium]